MMDTAEHLTGEERLGEGISVAPEAPCSSASNPRDEHLQDSVEDQTEEYSLGCEDAVLTHSPVQYCDEDFESCDDSDENLDEAAEEESNDMGKIVSKRKSSQNSDISGNSSDDNMERPRKETKPKQKKYIQTTLNFGATGASYAGVASTSRPSRKAKSDSTTSVFKRMGDRDTENYRLGYPGQRDNLRLNANVEFYKGKISSYPDGAFIDEIHNDWWGNFNLLERHHGYIQWIFPIREEGMNWQAQALQLHEAKEIMADEEAHNRVMLSYEMMLDFFGMKLEDRRTGKLRRSKRYKECYENLNYSSHNYLRITRILKSLGEFGLEHLKKPFLEFILTEIVENGQLQRTLNSLKNYWIGTIKSDADREELYQLV